LIEQSDHEHVNAGNLTVFPMESARPQAIGDNKNTGGVHAGDPTTVCIAGPGSPSKVRWFQDEHWQSRPSTLLDSADSNI
jgi:hypothetical protein